MGGSCLFNDELKNRCSGVSQKNGGGTIICGRLTHYVPWILQHKKYFVIHFSFINYNNIILFIYFDANNNKYTSYGYKNMQPKYTACILSL